MRQKLLLNQSRVERASKSRIVRADDSNCVAARRLHYSVPSVSSGTVGGRSVRHLINSAAAARLNHWAAFPWPQPSVVPCTSRAVHPAMDWDRQVARQLILYRTIVCAQRTVRPICLRIHRLCSTNRYRHAPTLPRLSSRLRLL
jgi:hypothetical protein